MPRPLPPPSSDAFVVDADAGPDGDGDVRAYALCIHGYTGCPYEVLPIALALKSVATTSTGIVLPGHEGGVAGDPRALNKTTWRQWLRAGLDAFDALPSDKPRFVVGCSMGALVALLIAAERDVAGVIALAPALRFFKDGQLAAAVAGRGLWRAVPYLKKTGGSDIADDEARHTNPCMPYLPLRGIYELSQMQRAALDVLPSVSAPLCAIHGGHDHTIPRVSSEILCRSVSSARVEHHVLRDSFHVVGIDVDRDQVDDIGASFVSETLASHASAP